MKRLLKNRPLMIAYCVMGLGFLGSLGLVRHQDVVQDYRRCEDSADSRAVLRDVVIEATSGGDTLPLTSIPSFQSLDPETQQYLRDLESLSASAPNQEDDPNSFRNRALRLIPIPECEEPTWYSI